MQEFQIIIILIRLHYLIININKLFRLIMIIFLINLNKLCKISYYSKKMHNKFIIKTLLTISYAIFIIAYNFCISLLYNLNTTTF